MSKTKAVQEFAEGSLVYQSLHLPASLTLPIHHLSACFNNVTNSYKFYWFLALLAEVEAAINQEAPPIIPMHHLFSRMLAEVWYPVNQFRLHFGKQDKLGCTAQELQQVSGLASTADEREVTCQVRQLLESNDYLPLKKQIISLQRYVPQRFIRPWFAKELQGVKDPQVDKSIERLARDCFETKEPASTIPLYRFTDQKEIEIHPLWFPYLKQHSSIIRGFCMWHLLCYLQKRNPNTPGLTEKLSAPRQRDMKDAKKYWNLVFQYAEDAQNPLSCIYSGQPLKGLGANACSIDHFLPWSFVAHDLVWNLIPVPTSINSAKSDNLPDMDRYFCPFATMQYDALHSFGPNDKIPKQCMEDYVIVTRTKDAKDLFALPETIFVERLQDTIAPQVQIAANMGFHRYWIYQNT